MKIVYENKNILVCEKPSHLLSQSAKNQDDSLVVMVKDYLNASDVGIINRLDAGVGGLVLFGKNTKTTSYLSKELLNGKITKRYLAICEGRLEDKSGFMEDYLVRDEKNSKTIVASKSTKDAKKAILEYDLLCEAKGDYTPVSLVKINLITGRTHQIRAQFSSRGYPLVGDKKYGCKDKGSSIALHSYYLSFRDIDGEKIEIYSFPQNIYPWDLFGKEFFEER